MIEYMLLPHIMEQDNNQTTYTFTHMHIGYQYLTDCPVINIIRLSYICSHIPYLSE